MWVINKIKSLTMSIWHFFKTKIENHQRRRRRNQEDCEHNKALKHQRQTAKILRENKKKEKAFFESKYPKETSPKNEGNQGFVIVDFKKTNCK